MPEPRTAKAPREWVSEARPDHRLSPHTGWTREHWAALADRTLRAVRPYASAGGAFVSLPGPASHSGTVSDGLEGFARTMLTAGFRIAGDPDSAAVAEHAEFYARGLVLAGDGEAVTALPSVSLDVDPSGCSVGVDWPDGQLDRVRLDPPAQSTAPGPR